MNNPTPTAKPSKRILVVDDHADTRMLTAIALRRAGYDVETAETKAEALKICRERGFDVLMSDIGLPDGNGVDLLQELLKHCPIKGIAYTGYAYESDVQKCKNAGYSAHLAKPVDLDVMLKTIARVLDEPDV